MALVAAFPAGAAVKAPHKTPTVVGSGGSASTVDPLATQTAIKVLRSGGNAIDAAVAAAGVLGVTEPFSCGIGGGGFMVIYDAKHKKVDTIDSREAAPAGLKPTSFEPYSAPDKFTEAYVSGLSVGVPGTVSGWQTALKRYGTHSLRSVLKPAERIARKGFVIDKTFNGQVDTNKEIFDDFTATRDLYLTKAAKRENRKAKPVGSVQKNPDLARTYVRIGKDPRRFYRGGIARDIARTVRRPPEAADSDRPHKVHPGSMSQRDLRRYKAIRRAPTRVSYRGHDVYGMAPPSSGGTTVGEALNILEALPPTADRVTLLHRYLEASKLAYADRNAYVADPGAPGVDVPLRGLLSDAFGRERSKLISDTSTLSTPQAAGNPSGAPAQAAGAEEKAKSTTHLTVADRMGNIVSYTFTIEQIGGSGMVVPGRGFLLNNELTDFNFAPGTPNSPAPFKRPRSSMAPTIVLKNGRPELALGSPGGATIITTVLQTLVNYIDLKQSLPAAVAAPRASQRNTEPTPAEPAFIAQDGPALTALGHAFSTVTPDPPAEIGSVEAIRFLKQGRQQAVAEPTRRGGGHAMVVRR
jgi:gamma-glutamyltranspeptidase / glutathione hydrolase